MAAGTYQVVLAGPSFNVPIGPFTLAKAVTTSTGTTSSSGGSLAHTGLTVALWVLVALALAFVGYLITRTRGRRHQQ
jgi:hypothetical protein